MMLFDCIISQLIVKGLSKTHQDFISINEFFSKITPSLFTIKEAFFRKPTSPPLPLREGPPLISVFSPQGRRGNRPTRCSNRFAIRLADHQRSRQQRSCGLRYATAWTKIAYGLLGACSKLFRKPTSPPLPLREGPPLISVFSPQGRRGNRSSSSLVTISFYGWRTIRGLRQQRSCGFLCGDKPAFTQGFA